MGGWVFQEIGNMFYCSWKAIAIYKDFVGMAEKERKKKKQKNKIRIVFQTIWSKKYNILKKLVKKKKIGINK